MNGPEPMGTPLHEAKALKRATRPAYERTLRCLTYPEREAIQSYVRALHAEAAARRNEASRYLAALERARIPEPNPYRNGEHS